MVRPKVPAHGDDENLRLWCEGEMEDQGVSPRWQGPNDCPRVGRASASRSETCGHKPIVEPGRERDRERDRSRRPLRSFRSRFSLPAFLGGQRGVAPKEAAGGRRGEACFRRPAVVPPLKLPLAQLPEEEALGQVPEEDSQFQVGQPFKNGFGRELQGDARRGKQPLVSQELWDDSSLAEEATECLASRPASPQRAAGGAPFKALAGLSAALLVVGGAAYAGLRLGNDGDLGIAPTWRSAPQRQPEPLAPSRAPARAISQAPGGPRGLRDGDAKDVYHFDFVPLVPGGSANQACRGSDVEEDSDANAEPRQISVHHGVHKLEDCQELCRMQPLCSGVEYGNTGQCEIWKTEISHSTPRLGFHCLRFGPAANFEAVRHGGNRACGDRHAAAAGGIVRQEASTLAECKVDCLSLPGCRGLGFSLAHHLCELWTQDITVTHPADSSVCLRRRGDLAAAKALFPRGELAATKALALPTTSKASAPRCAHKGKYCQRSRCCRDPTLRCYEKDRWWATCKASCEPGIDPSEAKEYRTPWSCAVLGQERRSRHSKNASASAPPPSTTPRTPPAPLPVPPAPSTRHCAHEGENCISSGRCCEAGLRCYKVGASVALCRPGCLAGDVGGRLLEGQDFLFTNVAGTIATEAEAAEENSSATSSSESAAATTWESTTLEPAASTVSGDEGSATAGEHAGPLQWAASALPQAASAIGSGDWLRSMSSGEGGLRRRLAVKKEEGDTRSEHHVASPRELLLRELRLPGTLVNPKPSNVRDVPAQADEGAAQGVEDNVRKDLLNHLSLPDTPVESALKFGDPSSESSFGSFPFSFDVPKQAASRAGVGPANASETAPTAPVKAERTPSSGKDLPSGGEEPAATAVEVTPWQLGEYGAKICPPESAPIRDARLCATQAALLPGASGCPLLGGASSNNDSYYISACENANTSLQQFWCAKRPLGCWQDRGGCVSFKGGGADVAHQNARPVCQQDPPAAPRGQRCMPLGPWARRAHGAAPRRPSRSAAVSPWRIKLFCFTVALSNRVAKDIVNAQLGKGFGIDACDFSATIPSEEGAAPPTWQQRLAGYRRVWLQVYNDHRYLLADWIVRSEPDAVLLPGNLRQQLAEMRVLAGVPLYVQPDGFDEEGGNGAGSSEEESGKWTMWLRRRLGQQASRGGTRRLLGGGGSGGFSGPFDILSKEALQLYVNNSGKCSPDSVSEQYFEHSPYMSSCLDLLGASYVLGGKDLLDSSGRLSACNGANTAFLQPFPSLQRWTGCYTRAMNLTWLNGI